MKIFQTHPKTAFRLFYSKDIVDEQYVEQLQQFALKLWSEFRIFGSVIYLWFPQINPALVGCISKAMDNKWRKIKIENPSINEYDDDM